jgi:acetate kinase
MVMKNLTFLGAKLDEEKNVAFNHKEADISADDSRVKILLIPTNEEIAIARDTLALVTGK